MISPLAYSSHERLKSTEPSSRFWITVQGPIHFAIIGRRWFAGAIMCSPLSGELISEQSLGSALTIFSYCISTLSSSSKSCAVECIPSSVKLEPRRAVLFAFVSICEWETRWKFNYNYDMTGIHPFFCCSYFYLFSSTLWLCRRSQLRLIEIWDSFYYLFFPSTLTMHNKHPPPSRTRRENPEGDFL